MDDLQSSYKRFLNSVTKSKHQVDSVNDLQRVYSLLSNEITKAQHNIDGIDSTIENCNRLSREFWYDKRAEAVAYLDGLYKAYDIVFKEIHK